MNYAARIAGKKGVVFDLDDVIYPAKDYLLQVYYLFAQFMEYTEQIPAGPLIAFMKKRFEETGTENMFKATADEFSLPAKYEVNFNMLLHTARLPLKLLLFKEVLALMQEANIQGKHVFLLVSGAPEMQLNKIRQIEWNALETSIKVYFLEEMGVDRQEGLALLADKFNLNPVELLDHA